MWGSKKVSGSQAGTEDDNKKDFFPRFSKKGTRRKSHKRGGRKAVRR